MFWGRMKWMHSGRLSTLLSCLILGVHSSGNNGILGSPCQMWWTASPPVNRGFKGGGERYARVCFLGWGRPSYSAIWRRLILLPRNLDMFWRSSKVQVPLSKMHLSMWTCCSSSMLLYSSSSEMSHNFLNTSLAAKVLVGRRCAVD